MDEVLNVIDAHVHVFPDKIADKSKENVSRFYELPMYTVGTSGELKRIADHGFEIDGKRYRFSHQLICSPALSAAQTASINGYIADLVKSEERFIGYGTLHPDNGDYEQVIDSIIELGLKGLKFHSDFQQFDIDDKRMYPVYRYAAKKGLPVLFHMGDRKLEFSRPFRLANVLNDIPELVAVAAHTGGYSHWDEAISLPVSPNLYFDISSSLAFLKGEQLYRFFERFGYERFFFGSDFPMWSPVDELKTFISFGYDEKIQRAVEYDNFARFIGLEQA